MLYFHLSSKRSTSISIKREKYWKFWNLGAKLNWNFQPRWNFTCHVMDARPCSTWWFLRALCHNSYCSQFNIFMNFRSSFDFPISLRYSSILTALVQSVNVSAHLCILKREFSIQTDESSLIFDRSTVLRTGWTLSDSRTTNLSINEILFTGFTAHVSIAREELFCIIFHSQLRSVDSLPWCLIRRYFDIISILKPPAI